MVARSVRLFFPAIAAPLLCSVDLAAQWTLRATPFTGNVVAAAYDEHRAVAVAIVMPPGGGNVPQTWEWNGVLWQQNPTAGNPGAVVDHELALVYDPGQRRLLAFDGEGPGSNGGYVNEYRGVSWQSIAPASGAPRPPATTTIAAAFDRTRNVAVVRCNDQTWEWNGAWTLRATTASPGRIDYSRCEYDWLRQRVVLVGGEVHDPLLQVRYTNPDLFEWDGAQWLHIGAFAQSTRVLHATAYDGTRGRVVTYGGANTRGSGPLWLTFGDYQEWTGTNWVAAAAPPAFGVSTRTGAHLANDLARGSMLLVGSETWELVRPGAATLRIGGDGCPGTAGTPALSLDGGRMPWLGQTLQLQLTGLGTTNAALFAFGLSNTLWNAVVLPAPIPGAPNCFFRVGLDAVQFLPVTGGVASVGLSIPNDAALVGLSLFGQGFAPDAGANPTGLITSNALEVQVGSR